jgi:hypothetical protein
MTELAKGRLRSKLPRLEQALTGLVRDHYRQWLTLPLASIDFLAALLDTLSVAMTHRLTDLGAGGPPAIQMETPGTAGSMAALGTPPHPLTCARALTILDTIPGVDQHRGSGWYPIAASTWGALRPRTDCRPGAG